MEAYACQVVFVLKRKKVYKKVLFIKNKVFSENKTIWEYHLRDDLFDEPLEEGSCPSEM